eukprot:942709-Rhodomonas_salina.3
MHVLRGLPALRVAPRRLQVQPAVVLERLDLQPLVLEVHLHPCARVSVSVLGWGGQHVQVGCSVCVVQLSCAARDRTRLTKHEASKKCSNTVRENKKGD